MATSMIASTGTTIPPLHSSAQVKPISPYGLPIVDSCQTCNLRQSGFFCGLSPVALQAIENAKHTSSYPEGALVFVEGQGPRGVYLVCQGKVKLLTTSRDGKTLILKIAHPGDVLGMNSVIARTPYEATAETLQPCQLAYIGAADFLEILTTHGDAAMQAAQHLSRDCQSAYGALHSMGLSNSAAGKLAQFLLQWSEKGLTVEGILRATLALTHEEIAQLIGASRETVTRLFGQFKKQRWAELSGSTLLIRNKLALENLTR
jgi:CRP/FNR family transcriptional regulator, cyclic AMP receptor protein